MVRINTHSLAGMISREACFADTRENQGQRHTLFTVISLVIIGYMCGRTSYRQIYYLYRPDIELKEGLIRERKSLGKVDLSTLSRWEKDKEKRIREAEEKAHKIEDMLKEYFSLPHGIPNFSTFSRTIEKVDQEALLCSIYEYFIALLPPLGWRQYSFDGKANRAANNKASTGKSLYIINGSDVLSRLLFTSFAVGDKTNEAKSLCKQLPNLILCASAIVTTDAMGTGREIVQEVQRLGSKYVLPVKKNNPKLKELIFDYMVDKVQTADAQLSYSADSKYSKGSCIKSIILDTNCAIVEEDNPKYDEEDQDKTPIDDHIFFDNLYTYPSADIESIKNINVSRTNKDLPDNSLVLVKIRDRLVPMKTVHGRLEHREVEALPITEYLKDKPVAAGFESVSTVMLVTRYRGKRVHKNHKNYWEITVSRTPYISNIDDLTAEPAKDIIIRHWTIERTHFILDERFREDRCTARKGDSSVILSALRKCALNIQTLVAWGWTLECSDSDCFEDNLRKLFGLLHDNIKAALEYYNKPFHWGSTNPLTKLKETIALPPSLLT